MPPAISPRSCSGCRCASKCRPGRCAARAAARHVGRGQRQHQARIAWRSRLDLAGKRRRGRAQPEVRRRIVRSRRRDLHRARRSAPAPPRAPNLLGRQYCAALEPIPPRRLFAFIAHAFFRHVHGVSRHPQSCRRRCPTGPACRLRLMRFPGADGLSDCRSQLHHRAIGTRMLFTISAGGFTDRQCLVRLQLLDRSMIVWRAIQGFIGGGMVPNRPRPYSIFQGPRQKLWRRSSA